MVSCVPIQAVFCFGNLVGNFYWSINRSSIWSIRLLPMHPQKDNWPNFSGDVTFGQSKLKCFQWRLTKTPFCQSPIRSIQVLFTMRVSNVTIENTLGYLNTVLEKHSRYNKESFRVTKIQYSVKTVWWDFSSHVISLNPSWCIISV